MSPCVRVRTVFLVLALAAGARADVTLRSRVTIKPGAQFPAALREQMTKALAALPTESVFMVKGGLVWTSSGAQASLLDLNTLKLTTIDQTHKQYAVMALSDLTDAMNRQLAPLLGKPGMGTMPRGLAMQVASSATGKTDTVLNVPVVETVVTITATLDPAGLPPSAGAAGMPPMSLGRIELHFWRATPPAILQSPALLELARLHGAAWTTVNPAGPMFSTLVQKVFGTQFRDVLTKLQSDTAPVLRMQLDAYSPFLASMMKAQAGRGRSPLAGGDWDSPDPLISVNSEAVELSGDPVDAARVAVPDGFQEVSLDAYMKAAYPAPKLPALAASAAAGRGAGSARSSAAGPRLGQPAPPRLPPAPNAGQPIPAAQLAWLAGAGPDTAAVRANPGYPSLLHEAAPAAIYHLGRDMPILDAFQRTLAGAPEAVRTDGGETVISAGAGHFPAGMLWVDREGGTAIGAILFQPGNDGPAPTVTLFSNQISGAIHRLNQLPPAFAAKFESWSVRTPAFRSATYFINAQGEKTVVVHDEDYCQLPAWRQQHKTDCAAANLAAARADHAAIIYVEFQQQGATADVMRGLVAKEAEWQTAMRSQCGTPAAADCELRATRDRVSQLLRH